MTTANTPSYDDDMPDEIDFSSGVRGKFYRPDATFNVPVYLDAEVQAYLSVIASKKGIALSDLANDLLKKEIAILETERGPIFWTGKLKYFDQLARRVHDSYSTPNLFSRV